MPRQLVEPAARGHDGQAGRRQIIQFEVLQPVFGIGCKLAMARLATARKSRHKHTRLAAWSRQARPLTFSLHNQARKAPFPYVRDWELKTDKSRKTWRNKTGIFCVPALGAGSTATRGDTKTVAAFNLLCILVAVIQMKVIHDATAGSQPRLDLASLNIALCLDPSGNSSAEPNRQNRRMSTQQNALCELEQRTDLPSPSGLDQETVVGILRRL